MIKWIGKIISIFCLSIFAINADEISAEFNPKNPLVGEPFTMDVKVRSLANNRPYVSFDPYDVEVLGRTDTGVSIKSSYVNGKFATVKEFVYRYELVANKEGMIRINNLKADIDGKVIRGRSYKLNILKEERRAPAIFLKSHVSKETPFINELVNLEIYLYYRVAVVGNEFKKYPKLEGFIKRFYKVDRSQEETVEVNGEIFKRILVYNAKLYPQKPGRLIIDPMVLRVQFDAGGSNSPFGGFGLAFRNLKTRDIQSEKVFLEVNPQPAINVPSSFTGVVGDHEVKLTFNKTKLLVNEVVEARLEVKGPGALENMEAPTLIQTEDFEKFDVKTEINEQNDGSAIKIFDYTYLARESTIIEEKTIDLSFLNPESNNFITKKITIPRIQVEGGAVSTQEDNRESSKNKDLQNQSFFIEKEIKTIISPVFEITTIQNAFNNRYIRYISFSLFFLNLFILMKLGLKNKVSLKKTNPYLASFYRTQTFGDFYRMINFDIENKDNTSVEEFIKNLKLNPKDEEYLLDIYHFLSEKEYSSKQTGREMKISTKRLKKIFS